MHTRAHLAALLLLLSTQARTAEQPVTLQSVLNTEIHIEPATFSEVRPIEIWQNKIFLTAAVNGREFRFILDTGSPTLITRAAADALGLEGLAENRGMDANGNTVVTQATVLQRLQIGEVVFAPVPALIMETTGLDVGARLLDGGIIGSELMPLAVWQINFQKQTLTLSHASDSLDHVRGVPSAELHVSPSYPRMPIVAHRINGAFTDRALFDTGSSELVHLNQHAYDELRKRRLLKNTLGSAHGSFGESGGGRGADSEFHWLELARLQIGELDLTNLRVWTRPQPPTLIGSAVLASHVVTLDYPKGSIHFDPFAPIHQATIPNGLRLGLRDGVVEVALLLRNGPAEKAGLELHDEVLRINGQSLQMPEGADIKDWLLTVREWSQSTPLEITVRRAAEVKKFKLTN